MLILSQIDLESSEDDIQEIQQEISVLSTCASPYVTQYKESFLRGHKLWIVMEYLGGGSCLDLVGHCCSRMRGKITDDSSLNLRPSMKRTLPLFVASYCLGSNISIKKARYIGT